MGSHNAPQLYNLPLFGLLSVSMIIYRATAKKCEYGVNMKPHSYHFSVLLSKPIRGHGERNPQQVTM